MTMRASVEAIGFVARRVDINLIYYSGNVQGYTIFDINPKGI
jgi:hypothetical protein